MRREFLLPTHEADDGFAVPDVVPQHADAGEQQRQEESRESDHPPFFPQEGELHDVVWGEELVEVEGIDIDRIDLEGEAFGLVEGGIDHDLEWREVVEGGVPRCDGVGLADGHAFPVVEHGCVWGCHLHDFDVGHELLAGLDIGQPELLPAVEGDGEVQCGLLSDEELEGVELDIDLHLCFRQGAEGAAEEDE